MPFSNSSDLGRFSSKFLIPAGISYTTQWTQVPGGASGSRQDKVKLLVPSSTSDHSSLGEISFPSQVYWMGMRSSFRNAVAVNSKLMFDTPFVPGWDWIATVNRIVLKMCLILDILVLIIGVTTTAEFTVYKSYPDSYNNSSATY